MKIKKREILNIFISLLWLTIGGAGIFLLVAASKEKDAKKCKEVNISIDGGTGDFFIDKNDVLNIIKQSINGDPVGTNIAGFNLRNIEAALEKDIWIKNAEVFFDNNNVLSVDVKERQPVARVFANSGSSFYIDSTAMVLPLSEKFSARLPVFTSFLGNEAKLNKMDSALLNNVKIIGTAIAADTFLMAMIDQVDIKPDNSFRLIPKIGRQVVEFGDAADCDKKFEKLKLFYKNIMTKAGWDRYSVINLQYSNQVVAKIRGQEDKTADSLRTMQLLDIIAANAAQMAADSTRLNSEVSEKLPNDISIIEESKEREDNAADSTPVPVPRQQVLRPTQQPSQDSVRTPPPVRQNTTVPAPPKPQPVVRPAASPKPVVSTPPKPNARPSAIPKPKPKPAQQPRAVMPKPVTN